MGTFYSRRFYFSQQLENYVNQNKIEQHQIVSITNMAGAGSKGEYVSLSYLYFYSNRQLEYDLFYAFSEEDKQQLKSKAVEIEEDNTREERLSALKNSLNYHSNPENYSIKMPEQYHAEAAAKIQEELNSSNGAIYTKVIALDHRHIVPREYIKYDGKDFMDLILKLNPLVKIETKWVYIQ